MELHGIDRPGAQRPERGADRDRPHPAGPRVVQHDDLLPRVAAEAVIGAIAEPSPRGLTGRVDQPPGGQLGVNARWRHVVTGRVRTQRRSHAVDGDLGGERGQDVGVGQDDRPRTHGVLERRLLGGIPGLGLPVGLALW